MVNIALLWAAAITGPRLEGWEFPAITFPAGISHALKTGSHAAFGRQNADDTPYWPKNPSDAHVCSMQFVTGKPNSGLLHPDFVPHLFSFTPVHEHEHARASLQRYSKMQERYQAGSFSHHMKPHPQ